MMTLVQREARLAEFLRDLFPGHRVVPSLLDHAAARGSGVVSLPEIRIRLVAIDGAVLRWEVVFAQGDLRDDAVRRIGALGVYTSADALRGTLAGWPWSCANARLLPRSPDADLWREELVEPWTPAGAYPQALFARAEVAAVMIDAADEGTRDLGELELADNPPEVGDRLVIVTPTMSQYLGAVESVDPTLVVEHALLRDFPAQSFLYRVDQPFLLPEAAAESVVYTPRESSPLTEALDGRRRLHRIHAESFELELALPHPPATLLAQWVAYRLAHGARPSLLLARADLSLAEVTPSREEISSTRLALRFIARHATDFSAFEEVSP